MKTDVFMNILNFKKKVNYLFLNTKKAYSTSILQTKQTTRILLIFCLLY